MLGNGHAAGTVSTVTRRAFASSGSNLTTWGFIGLGRMGKHSNLNGPAINSGPRRLTFTDEMDDCRLSDGEEPASQNA